MITREQYFGWKIDNAEVTEATISSADTMLEKVNRLLDAAREAGRYHDDVCPNTDTQISGSRGGSGDGGFRLSNSSTGASHSMHKTAHAVDVYDPGNVLDDWISVHDEDGGAQNSLLEQFGLYREHPGSTPGWCHLQDEPPHSGRRTFLP